MQAIKEYRRIAVFGGIYNNTLALEATMEDAHKQKFPQDSGTDVLLCTHIGIKWQRRLPEIKHPVNVGVIGRPENDGQPNVR